MALTTFSALFTPLHCGCIDWPARRLLRRTDRPLHLSCSSKRSLLARLLRFAPRELLAAGFSLALRPTLRDHETPGAKDEVDAGANIAGWAKGRAGAGVLRASLGVSRAVRAVRLVGRSLPFVKRWKGPYRPIGAIRGVCASKCAESHAVSGYAESDGAMADYGSECASREPDFVHEVYIIPQTWFAERSWLDRSRAC